MSGESIRPLSRIGLGGLTLAGGLADVTPLHAQVAQASVQEGQVSWNGMDIIPSRVLAVNDLALNEFAAKTSSPDSQYLADFKYAGGVVPDESLAQIKFGDRSLLQDGSKLLPIVSAKVLDNEKYTPPNWNSEQHVRITLALGSVTLPDGSVIVITSDNATSDWLFVWRKADGLNAATNGAFTILRGPDGQYYIRPNSVRLTIENDPINPNPPIPVQKEIGPTYGMSQMEKAAYWAPRLNFNPLDPSKPKFGPNEQGLIRGDLFILANELPMRWSQAQVDPDWIAGFDARFSIKVAQIFAALPDTMDVFQDVPVTRPINGDCKYTSCSYPDGSIGLSNLLFQRVPGWPTPELAYDRRALLAKEATAASVRKITGSAVQSEAFTIRLLQWHMENYYPTSPNRPHFDKDYAATRSAVMAYGSATTY